MKKIVAGMAFAAALMGSTAFAADLVVVDEQTMDFASDTSWSGFYAGVGITGAYNVDFAETFGFGDVIVGANVQADSFVFGAEAYLSGWRSNLAGPGWSGGAEVRAGYLVAPEVLVYVSGGAMHFITGGATYGQLGVGAEFMVAEDLSLDLEYKYWRELGGAGVFQTHSVSASLLWHF